MKPYVQDVLNSKEDLLRKDDRKLTREGDIYLVSIVRDPIHKANIQGMNGDRMFVVCGENR